MSSYSAGEARENFAHLLNEVAYGRERVVITRRNKPLAVVVTVEDWEYLEWLEEQEDIRESKKALAEYKKTGESISLEKLAKELGWDTK